MWKDNIWYLTAQSLAQFWQLCKCICNAFIMSKYGNSFVMAVIHSKIYNFVITFVHNTKEKHKLSPKPWWTIRICVSWKFQIWPNNFWCLHIYCLTPNLSMNWQCPQIDSHIMNALWMHLCGLQIWHCLPCYNMYAYRTLFVTYMLCEH
jgi:hypothetical protein